MAHQPQLTVRRECDEVDEPKPRILVVDDDEEARELLVFQLELSGYRPVAVGTGIAGVRAARAVGPDAIVLDLNLPDMHGLDVLRMIRADVTLERTPVVVVSGERPFIASQALLEGADALLAKPLDFEDLVAALRRLNTEAPDVSTGMS